MGGDPRSSMKIIVRKLLFPLAFFVAAGCDTRGDNITIVRPEYPTGPGLVYPVKDVTFTTVDSVEISARYGQPVGPGPNPVVILVHDIGEISEFSDYLDISERFARLENQVLGGLGWLIVEVFERLLEEGYSPLAIDLRGHGNTPYPFDGRPQPSLQFSDLGNLYLDVRAALNWLKTEPSADIARVAIVGAGVGGDVAFLSMGIFPDDLQAGVALSPGIVDPRTQNVLALGELGEDFAPHSMMFLVAENDIRQVSEDLFFRFVDFASFLNDHTKEKDPENLVVYEGQAHGLALLENPEVVDTLLSWLDKHL